MTDYRSLYDKEYIGAWDIADKDVTVTILKVIGGSLTAVGGRKSKKPVIYMKGTEKGFAVNATNGKTIATMYGPMIEDWVGKRITLFKSTTRSPSGDGEVECIRVRPKVPPGRPANPTEQVTQQPPLGDAADDAPTDESLLADIQQRGPKATTKDQVDFITDLARSLTSTEAQLKASLVINEAKKRVEATA